MQRLKRQVAAAASGNLSLDWLKPLMHRRNVQRGDVIFRKGDPSTEMFFTIAGRYHLPEIGPAIGEGKLVGEMGLVGDSDFGIA